MNPEQYEILDRVLEQPVLKRDLFPDPVVIESVELLRDRKSFICRVRSTDWAEGVSIGHPFISLESYPVFVNALIPFFTGKDARDLDALLHEVAESQVKKQGVPFCVQLATLEFAILDMLGNIAEKPAGHVIGDLLNPEVDIYLGHLMPHSVLWIARAARQGNSKPRVRYGGSSRNPSSF